MGGTRGAPEILGSSEVAGGGITQNSPKQNHWSSKQLGTVRWAQLEKVELPLTAHSPHFSRKAGSSGTSSHYVPFTVWRRHGEKFPEWEASLHRSRVDEESPAGLALLLPSAGTFWEAANLGDRDWAGSGASKPPWRLRPPALLQESVPSNARDWAGPNWRFSSVHFTATNSMSSWNQNQSKQCCWEEMRMGAPAWRPVWRIPFPGPWSPLSSEETSGNPHPDSFDLLGSQITSTDAHSFPIIPPIFLPSVLSLPLRKSSWKLQKLCSKDNSPGRWSGAGGLEREEEVGRRTRQGVVLFLI